MIHAFYTYTHYWEHLLPIWRRLPREIRGVCTDNRQELLRAYRNGDVVLVAGGIDVGKLKDLPKIYLEHGAGQTYPGDYRSANHPSYSGGGSRHQNVIAYLAPNETVAARWDTDAPVHVVGCPKLQDIFRVPVGKLAAITFHFPATVCLEAGSAWPAWRDHAEDMVAWLHADGWEVIAHEHPRWDGEVLRHFANIGVKTVDSGGAVLASASLLIADNTSLMYEMAALRGSVIALNAPWWRRDVEHGLRFWEVIPGHDVTFAVDLFSKTPSQWLDTESRMLAEKAAAYCYAYVEDAADRAASLVAQIAGRK